MRHDVGAARCAAKLCETYLIARNLRLYQRLSYIVKKQ